MHFSKQERLARFKEYRAAREVVLKRDGTCGWCVCIGGDLKARAVSFSEAQRLGRQANNPESFNYVLDDRNTRLEMRDSYPWPAAVVIVLQGGCEVPYRFRTVQGAIEFWEQNANAYPD